ncbi:unnamed protein product [Sympodiomycopsis kandeliae]
MSDTKGSDTKETKSRGEVHDIFDDHRHEHRQKAAAHPHHVPAVAKMQVTGIFWSSYRLSSYNISPTDPELVNMGQGSPETGDIPGALPKPRGIDFQEMGDDVHHYGPTAGLPELREKVAEYYNREYRSGKELKYKADNVCIVPGGRAGLSRIAAVIGNVNLGYTIPVYTAYENLLSSFTGFVPIPTHCSEESGYRLTTQELRKEIRDRGLSAFLFSNPNNPTGAQIRDKELEELVQVGRDSECLMILDEFYSWYQYSHASGKEPGSSVSAAEYVENPEEDPIVLIDGLTKNWRCPGWRVCWVVGPTEMISALSAAGSFLDGGASAPMQKLAIQMLDPDRIKQDRLALQQHFQSKLTHILSRLSSIGLEVNFKPESTFYIWLNLSSLPAPINSGLVFAEECIKEKVLVTPGIFFDINPHKRRSIIDSPCESYIRISYGPPLKEIDRGLDAFERIVKRAREGHPEVGKNLADNKKKNADGGADKSHHRHLHLASSAGS